MDWALLVLALVILLQVETYDGKRSCKMDLDKPPHLVCHADPRPCLRESNADMAGTGETVQGTLCVDAQAEECAVKRVPKASKRDIGRRKR